MNLNLAVNVKEFVSPLIIWKMIIIIIPLFAATFFFGANAYAQENNNINNNNTTLLLEDMRALIRDQQGDLSSIRNTSSAQFEALTQMSTSFGKLQTQATYTALSVFFLGIGLVVFGLSLTTRSSPQIGKYLTLTIWALVVPVIILIGLFQYGIITGNQLFTVTEEPYFLLSLLLYIPIAIVIFLLLAQKGIVQDQTTHISRPILEMEKLVGLRERGLITEQEFQKLKTELLAKF